MFRAHSWAVLLVLGLGCGEPTLQVAVPLAIVNVAPHDGAVGISPEAVPVVCFSEEMDSAAVAGHLTLEDEAGTPVEGQTVGPTADAHCLQLGHARLDTETGYVLRMHEGLPSTKGLALAVCVTSRFRTGR